jgi:hypothetical protein
MKRIAGLAISICLVSMACWGQARAVQVRGKVVMQDGSPLPERADIICDDGKFHTFTDGSGKFSFMVQIVGDVTGGVTSSTHTARACSTLVASIPGFKSNRVVLQLSPGPDWLPPPIDLNSIVLRPQAKAGAATVSVTDLAIPKPALEAHERGMKAFQAGDLEKAKTELRKATEIFPQYALAWLDLAAVQTRAKNWPSALAAADQVIQLEPAKYPGAYQFRALALWGEGNVTGARDSAREAVKLDADHRSPKLACLLGTLESEAGNKPGAIEAFQLCAKYATDPQDAEVAKQQLEQLTSGN